MPAVETVTVLITDLVGSTGLASRVGPAAADDLRHEHFTLLRDAVRAAGGEEVKSTGDGLMVVFRGAAAAVACAVAIQQRMERPQSHAPSFSPSGWASRWATRRARRATTSACPWSRPRDSAPAAVAQILATELVG
jgi:hypothetical protein